MDRVGGLFVDHRLVDFIENKAIPGTGILPERFWQGLESCIRELGPLNAKLLSKRDDLQRQIDSWLRAKCGTSHNPPCPIEYKRFLQDIGYIVPEGPRFHIDPKNVDPEIATVCGPQLVVPLSNARYAVNAANARWGSLYDALYSADIIPETAGLERNPSGAYNSKRGAEVVRRSKLFLDDFIPLALSDAKFAQVTDIALVFPEGLGSAAEVEFTLGTGGPTIKKVGLRNPEQFVGYRRVSPESSRIAVFLFKHNDLHIQIVIDREHSVVGRAHPAGIKDVVVEAAPTAIQDCEDSVAVVDAEDKVQLYDNWLGLMQGSLVSVFSEGARKITRKLTPDFEFVASATGAASSLPGRSILLIRNVGIHMYTDIARVAETETQVPEGILDAFVTSLIAMHDLKKRGGSNFTNSRKGSIYIVKPKLHGPDEVDFSIQIFERVEACLGLPIGTLKMGLMDEERRTTLNLKECVRAARHRIIFINTGFLDRTADEIHTSFEAGPFDRKGQLKSKTFLKAYEDWNVDVALDCGFAGLAQIGKGMWAVPDRMADLLASKIEHPRAGASTAWVPSPVAAVVHVLHFHMVSVPEVQRSIAVTRKPRPIEHLLELPLLGSHWRSELSQADILDEVENNCQGLLGYVVRWINSGVGCSKVPDIRNVGLMEDRATLRISSQHLANWLRHGVVDIAVVEATLKKMALIVDKQNASDPTYIRLSDGNAENNVAFQAASDLIFRGKEQANGYTEFILHKRRREFKESERLKMKRKAEQTSPSVSSLLAERQQSTSRL